MNLILKLTLIAIATVLINANCLLKGCHDVTIKEPRRAQAECSLSVNTDCMIVDGISAGRSCDAPIVGVTSCEQRPTWAIMLFNGGDCSQSDNRQPSASTCQDLNGGPPNEEGQQSHILVTDVRDSGIVYFSGIVSVGDYYRLNDDGERFTADQRITISTTDRSTVLQEVQYHTSCSIYLELSDRFGASQLIDFVNEDQGNVTCFSTFEYSVSIKVPDHVEEESIILTSMVARTNFIGNIDLTDDVVGEPLQRGGTFVVTLQATINACKRNEYNLDIDLEGIGKPSGRLCAGDDVVSFTAGLVPGARPTDKPSADSSPAPPCFLCEICFSGSNLVYVQGKGSIKIDQLQIGDYVMAYKERGNAGSTGSYSRVVSFSHHDSTREAEYLQIYTAINNYTIPLEISHDHMVKKDDGTMILAKTIRVGDVLDGGFVVEKIDTIIRRGLYSPTTESGMITVSGITSSCYVAVLEETTIPPIIQHNILHALYSPLRLLCKLDFENFCQNEQYTDGMSNYVGTGIQLVDSFGKLPILIKILMILCVVPLVIAMVVLDYIFGFYKAEFVFAFTIVGLYWFTSPRKKFKMN